MNSPATRSLAHLRKLGYTAQVVERYNMYARVRIDLFGFIDICCIKDGENGVLGIQTTSTSNFSARVAKCLALPTVKTWLLANNRLEIHGWSKKGKTGARKLWTLKELEIKLQDIV